MKFKGREISDFYQYNKYEDIMNNSDGFTINWTDIKQALSLVVVTIVIQACAYIISVGSIFSISWHALVDASTIPALVLIVSLLSSFLTTSQGNFVGLLKVK